MLSASKYQPVLDELQSDSESRQMEAVMNLSQVRRNVIYFS